MLNMGMSGPDSASSSPSVFLEVTGIHKRFGGVHALRGVSLTIERGKIYHLLGENGCGKSTLIKIISGAQPPDEGNLRIEGQLFHALTPIASLTAGIETVYQDLSLIPNLTVAENVALTEQLVKSKGGLARLLDQTALDTTARRALAAVNLPGTAAFLTTVVGTLPLAVRQLVAIARAIATQAKLVIMDEPTTSLTRREVDNLIRVVDQLRRDHVSVLFVTHKLDECFSIGGEAIVFRDGECVVQGPIQNFTKGDLAHWMTGRDIDASRYRHGEPEAQVLVSAHNLGSEGYFQNVSFELRRGEILGITGLADSGRNELARALAGALEMNSGEWSINAKPISLTSPADAIRNGIGYAPEDRLGDGLFLDKPILINMVASILDQLRTAFGTLNQTRSRKIAQELVDDLRIATPSVDLPVQSLSGGNQQRVLIGRSLTINPQLLVLHGPTVGVDVGSKDTIYKAVQGLAQKGLGVIIISDDLPELIQNADRILVMRNGRIDSEFSGAGVQEEDLYRAMLAANKEVAGV